MKETFLAAGGALSALAASTCCLLPLALVLAGAGGAWSASLSVLAPFQPLFILISLGCLGAGFWLVYGRSNPICETDACGTSTSARFLKSVLLVKIALWVGAMLVTLSIGVDLGMSLI